jgi:hypothetical protein
MCMCEGQGAWHMVLPVITLAHGQMGPEPTLYWQLELVTAPITAARGHTQQHCSNTSSTLM